MSRLSPAGRPRRSNRSGDGASGAEACCRRMEARSRLREEDQPAALLLSRTPPRPPGTPSAPPAPPQGAAWAARGQRTPLKPGSRTPPCCWHDRRAPELTLPQPPHLRHVRRQHLWGRPGQGLGETRGAGSAAPGRSAAALPGAPPWHSHHACRRPCAQEASFKEFLSRPENRGLVEQHQRKEVKQAIQLQEKARALEFREKVCVRAEARACSWAQRTARAARRARQRSGTARGTARPGGRARSVLFDSCRRRRHPSPPGRCWTPSTTPRRRSPPFWRTACCGASCRPSPTTPTATFRSGPATRA